MGEVLSAHLSKGHTHSTWKRIAILKNPPSDHCPEATGL